MDLIDKELFKMVDGLIDKKKRKNIYNQKFWYPLNQATYDAEEIVYALQSMLDFQTSMGRKVNHLEEVFAKYIGTKKSIFLNSGSSADLLAIRALVKSPLYDLNEGDRVLVPAITWPTQVFSIVQAGLIPILYDVSKHNINPDITTVDKEILVDAKAIFTTHILGTCGDIGQVLEICEEYKLLLIEDTCESLGASYCDKKLGTFGVAGTFSSFFSHHIMTIEGGFIVSDCDDLNSQIMLLRAHGWSRGLKPSALHKYLNVRGIDHDELSSIDSRYAFIDEGYNVRPNEITASFGIVQMKKIEGFNKVRAELSQRFYSAVKEMKNILAPLIVDGCSPNYMALPLILGAGKSNRYAIEYLEKRGIETRPLIAGNLMRHPVARQLGLKKASDHLHGSDFHHEQSFYIGLSPMVTIDQLEEVILVIHDLDKELCNV